MLIINRILIPSPLTIAMLAGCVVLSGANGDSNLRLNRQGLEAVEGAKHLDRHDKKDLEMHHANLLNNLGKDKSTTTTNAVLSATMNAKDQHQDSYSHLHDNAHETDIGADHDTLLGNEEINGREIDDFGVDYIEPIEYNNEYPHEDYTDYPPHEIQGYSPDVIYSEGHPGHVMRSPMVHAGVHGSVHPSVHGHHISPHHHQFVDGGFVPGVHAHHVPDHGSFMAPEHGFVNGVGMRDHGFVPGADVHQRRRYIVRPANQYSEVAFAPPHSEFGNAYDMPWVGAADIY